MRCLRNSLLSVLSILALAFLSKVHAANRPPNIVFILADDLGWADVGVNGSSFYRTPHIDSLARQGMKFTDAYAACPVCSPTRAAIMTGKYPARLHLTDWLPGRGDQPGQKLARPQIVQHLPLDEITIAEALKPAGYVSGHVGKWHLGGKVYGPLAQGFDENIAGDQAGSPQSYFAPFARDGHVMPGLEDAPPGQYLTDRLTTEAVSFIERHKDQPFFLYLSHYTVHIPLKAKQALIDANLARTPTGPQSNAVYAAMIDSLDESVGRVLAKLDELGLSANTVVFFTSDNGGLSVHQGPNTPATTNAPLRNGKGYLQEGGIREPLFVKWPGHIRSGSLDQTPVCSIDFLPTILEMAGLKLPRPVDGVSLVPLLTEQGTLHRDTLYWHYPHYADQVRVPQATPGGGPGAAMREGNWKLIQHFDTGFHELYDLSKDLGETNNLAALMPDKVLAMAHKLHDWQDAVKAQWPTQNPDYKNPPIQPQPNGIVELAAHDAFVHGRNLRYEPQPYKNTLGYWTLKDDWAHWDFQVPTSGKYRMEVLQGCGTGSGGSKVQFEVGSDKLEMTVRDTGGFQNFVWRDLGTIDLAEGVQKLMVKPISKPGLAVMDLRDVKLTKLP